MEAIFRSPDDAVVIDTDSMLRDTMEHRQVPDSTEALDVEFSAVVAEPLPQQQERIGSAMIRFSSLARPSQTEVPQSKAANAAFNGPEPRT